jgi:hypothetical protein
MDMGADDAGDGQWLTHAEIAVARGISTASAIKLALRHRWRKQKDNRGTLRCLVPADFIGPQPSLRADTRAVSRADAAETGADLSAVIATLQTAVTLLGDQLAHERTRADIAQSELDDLRTKLADAQAELAAAQDQVEAARARTVAELEAATQAAQQANARAQAAADRAEALRQAEAERRARGRWARLRAAWRGE